MTKDEILARYDEEKREKRRQYYKDYYRKNEEKLKAKAKRRYMEKAYGEIICARGIKQI